MSFEKKLLSYGQYKSIKLSIRRSSGSSEIVWKSRETGNLKFEETWKLRKTRNIFQNLALSLPKNASTLSSCK